MSCLSHPNMTKMGNKHPMICHQSLKFIYAIKNFHNFIWDLSISENVFNKIGGNFKQEVNSLSYEVHPDLHFWKHITT